MIQGRIIDDTPVIKAYIYRNAPTFKGLIVNSMPEMKGVINTVTPYIIGKIKKAVDHEPEPYYEVSNEYGTTIIIGE